MQTVYVGGMLHKQVQYPFYFRLPQGFCGVYEVFFEKAVRMGEVLGIEKCNDVSHIHVTSNRSYNNKDALRSAINQIIEKRYFDSLER